MSTCDGGDKGHDQPLSGPWKAKKKKDLGLFLFEYLEKYKVDCKI